MLYTLSMTLPNQEDRGIEPDTQEHVQRLNENEDGVVVDGLGNIPEPEDSGTGSAGGGGD